MTTTAPNVEKNYWLIIQSRVMCIVQSLPGRNIIPYKTCVSHPPIYLCPYYIKIIQLLYLD